MGQFPCDMLFHSGLSCTANVIPRKTLNWPILMIILANSLACDAADKQLIYRGPGWMIYQGNILLKLLLSLYCIGKWPSNAFQCRTVMNTKTKNWKFVLPGLLVFLLRLWRYCLTACVFLGCSCVCGMAGPEGMSLTALWKYGCMSHSIVPFVMSYKI